MFELQQGMVLFFQYNAGGNFYLPALREHPMKGLLIIATHGYWNIGYESLKATINSDGKSTNFTFSTRFGKDNIAKIPETGAHGIVFTKNGGDELTMTDAFEKPVPVKVAEPYSFAVYQIHGRKAKFTTRKIQEWLLAIQEAKSSLKG